MIVWTTAVSPPIHSEKEQYGWARSQIQEYQTSAQEFACWGIREAKQVWVVVHQTAGFWPGYVLKDKSRPLGSQEGARISSSSSQTGALARIEETGKGLDSERAVSAADLDLEARSARRGSGNDNLGLIRVSGSSRAFVRKFLDNNKKLVNLFCPFSIDQKILLREIGQKSLIHNDHW